MNEPTGHELRTLEMPTSDGVIKLEIKVPRRPMRLAEIVPVVCHPTDVAVEKALEREEREGRPVSCKKGCSACCNQLVPLSAPEVFVLVDHIVAMPTDERDAVIARFEAVERALEERGVMPTLTRLMEEHESMNFSELAAAYFQLGIACPFLTSDGACGPYAVRPLMCRDFNVVTPAAWCAEPQLHQIRKVRTLPSASFPLASLTAELTGTRPKLIPLALALRFADAHVELARSTWPGLDLFAALVRALAA